MDRSILIIGYSVLFWVLLTGLPVTSHGQYHCISDEHARESLEQDESLRKKRDQFIQSLEQWKFTSRSDRQFSIPVVFHIVFNNPEENISEERILQQLDRLNEDFSFTNPDTSAIPERFRYLSMDSGIRFCLATHDPDGNPTDGITRTQTNTDIIGIRTINGRRSVFHEDLGGKNIWDSDRYLNIYICDMGAMGGLGARPFTATAEEDGVVLNYRITGLNDSESFGMGRIGTHEVGHFFNLEHTWGSFLGCDSDDGVRDTPRQFGPYFGCPTAPQFSCDGEDIFFTYMDFVDDPCMHLFTAGQVNRMLASIILARPGLTGSNVCDIPDTTTRDHTITLYPNPVSAGSLIISSRLDQELFEYYEVFNAAGKFMGAGRTPRSDWLALQIDTYPAGVYILILYTDQNTHSRKFIKSD